MKPNHFILIASLLAVLIIIFGITKGESQVFRPFKEIDSIPKNKGIIYIFLPSKVWKCEDGVVVNGKLVSNFPLYEDGCLIHYADPGKNIIHSTLSPKNDLEVDVVPGQAVFIKGLYRTGPTSFRKIEAATARSELKNYKLYSESGSIKLDKFNSIALISTTISKPVQPTTAGSGYIGLNSASNFNEFLENKLWDDIIKFEKLSLYSIREFTAKALEKYFSANVIFADSLNSLPAIQKLKPKYNKTLSVMLDEKRSYPYILSDSIDLKPFPHFRGDITRFFKDPANYKKIIGEIGQASNADLLAICNTYFLINRAEFSLGDIELVTELFLFYPDGTLFATTGKSLRASPVIAKFSAADFADALKLFPITITLALEEMTSVLRRKMKKK